MVEDARGVPVGPGRGSGAGSLVAYSLGITDLDPLKFDLLFERFLNPERVSMPDFDVDFCQYNRDRTIEYVKETYGADAVSQIATFGTLGAKAVVRDVARVLNIPFMKADRLAKLIPMQPGKNVTLDDAIKEVPEFREAIEGDEEYQELMRVAKGLEGITRNLGMHAGGVLIAPGALTDFCPLYNSERRARKHDQPVRQEGRGKRRSREVRLFLGLPRCPFLPSARNTSTSSTQKRHLSLSAFPLPTRKPTGAFRTPIRPPSSSLNRKGCASSFVRRDRTVWKTLWL